MPLDSIPPPEFDPTDVPEASPPLGDVAGFRAWYRARVLPRRYSASLHLLVHLTPLLLACAWGAMHLHDVGPWEWLTVPAAVVGGSLFVYWFHRHVLHRKRSWAYYAYRNHTLQHHRFFDYDHITRDGIDDLHITLFPAFAGPVLATFTLGASFVLSSVLGDNVAMLLLIVSNGYMLVYEAVHTISHLPEGHPLLWIPGTKFLREHHRLHHDPALMGKYNFNVVLPLFDWLFGAFTRERRERYAPKPPHGAETPAE